MRLQMQRVVTGLLAGVMLSGTVVLAQSSGGKDEGLNLELHANGRASAAEIGLPMYPGATLYQNPKNKDSDSQADLGFTFGDFHMEVIAVSYVTHDPAAKVLKFYRKPLSRYGQVLECDHGKPVGKLTVTNTGLTCSDEHGGHVQVNGSPNSGDDVELRAGWPHKFRVVGIDASHAGETRFGLVYLELPRDKDNSKAE
ncbi:MAG TPA: hypothetical protein VMD58_10485 [Acidobacteriaceae bacterium]|nr:hypothetical protein [Acidobacteriaceae bacterium]